MDTGRGARLSIQKEMLDMRTRLTSRASLLFLAFAVMLSIAALVSGFAPKANALEAGSPTAPTIQSDQADYPPGATVTLTGSGWQPMCRGRAECRS